MQTTTSVHSQRLECLFSMFTARKEDLWKGAPEAAADRTDLPEDSRPHCARVQRRRLSTVGRCSEETKRAAFCLMLGRQALADARVAGIYTVGRQGMLTDMCYTCDPSPNRSHGAQEQAAAFLS